MGIPAETGIGSLAEHLEGSSHPWAVGCVGLAKIEAKVKAWLGKVDVYSLVKESLSVNIHCEIQRCCRHEVLDQMS